MKNIISAVMLTISMILSVSANAYSGCKLKRDEVHIEFHVSNRTHDGLYLDMGHPNHGIITGNLDIPPLFTGNGVGCSDGAGTGFQSYIRLYRIPLDHPKQRHYLEEFYVNMPYNYFIYHPYILYTHDSSLCKVTIHEEWWKTGEHKKWKSYDSWPLKSGKNKLDGMYTEIVEIICEPPV